MRKTIVTLSLFVFVGLLAGCAPNHLKAPCPNFGANCTKTPVNSWNYNQ